MKIIPLRYYCPCGTWNSTWRFHCRECGVKRPPESKGLTIQECLDLDAQLNQPLELIK